MKSTLIKIIYKNTFAIKHKNKSLNLRIDLFGFDVCLFVLIQWTVYGVGWNLIQSIWKDLEKGECVSRMYYTKFYSKKSNEYLRRLQKCKTC